MDQSRWTWTHRHGDACMGSGNLLVGPKSFLEPTVCSENGQLSLVKSSG
jgi:hypothetical protein